MTSDYYPNTHTTISTSDGAYWHWNDNNTAIQPGDVVHVVEQKPEESIHTIRWQWDEQSNKEEKKIMTKNKVTCEVCGKKLTEDQSRHYVDEMYFCPVHYHLYMAKKLQTEEDKKQNIIKELKQ